MFEWKGILVIFGIGAILYILLYIRDQKEYNVDDKITLEVQSSPTNIFIKEKLIRSLYSIEESDISSSHAFNYNRSQHMFPYTHYDSVSGIAKYNTSEVPTSESFLAFLIPDEYTVTIENQSSWKIIELDLVFNIYSKEDSTWLTHRKLTLKSTGPDAGLPYSKTEFDLRIPPIYENQYLEWEILKIRGYNTGNNLTITEDRTDYSTRIFPDMRQMNYEGPDDIDIPIERELIQHPYLFKQNGRMTTYTDSAFFIESPILFSNRVDRIIPSNQFKNISVSTSIWSIGEANLPLTVRNSSNWKIDEFDVMIKTYTFHNFLVSEKMFTCWSENSWDGTPFKTTDYDYDFGLESLQKNLHVQLSILEFRGSPVLQIDQ